MPKGCRERHQLRGRIRDGDTIFIWDSLGQSMAFKFIIMIMVIFYHIVLIFIIMSTKINKLTEQNQ